MLIKIQCLYEENNSTASPNPEFKREGAREEWLQFRWGFVKLSE